MKEITIDGQRLVYELELEERFEYSDTYVTHFYDPVPEVSRIKKYKFFGKLINVKKYKKLFTVSENIENPRYTKEEVRNIIRSKLKLLNRKIEIERGEII